MCVCVCVYTVHTHTPLPFVPRWNQVHTVGTHMAGKVLLGNPENSGVWDLVNKLPAWSLLSNAKVIMLRCPP